MQSSACLASSSSCLFVTLFAVSREDMNDVSGKVKSTSRENGLISLLQFMVNSGLKLFELKLNRTGIFENWIDAGTVLQRFCPYREGYWLSAISMATEGIDSCS